MRHLALAAAFLAVAGPTAIGAVPAAAQDAQNDQSVLTRSVLEAVRANTEAMRQTNAALETLSSRLDRVEAATRNVPPAVEGLRTDVIAIRAAAEKMAGSIGMRRGAVSLKFGPFACGNESAASCAVNACKSVGYTNGFPLTVASTGSGPNVRPTSVGEATCYD